MLNKAYPMIQRTAAMIVALVLVSCSVLVNPEALQFWPKSQIHFDKLGFKCLQQFVANLVTYR